jgi:hypothetical protein
MTREEWDAQQNSLKKEYKYMPTSEKGKVEKVEVAEDDAESDVDPEKLKKDWNAFLRYAEEKKFRGKEELDKNDLGNKMYREYIKKTPGTSLNESVIPQIRKLYIDYRNQNLADIKAGKQAFAEGTNEENYMRHITLNELSENPNYVGQHLTQTYFPEAKIVTKENGKVVGEKVMPQYSPTQFKKAYNQ